jgi:hypothetical protein
MTRRLWVVGIIGLSVTAAMSCHRAGQSSLASIALDSLTGIVSITGTAFEQRLVLRSGNRTTYLSAATSDSAALSRMGGMEVVVMGKRGPKVFWVNRFTAVSVNGSPVADGVLKNENGKLVLETSNGRIPLGNPPVALRSMVAARIWIGGPLDTGPNFYGLIVPPR